MSDAMQSALMGAQFDGAITIREMGLQGMITLRTDLVAASKAVKKITGVAMPAARMISAGQGMQLAWMSPDEVMILCDHAKADALVADLGMALGSQHHLVVNVSDARAMFALSGRSGPLRDVIAKITPADIAGLPLGEMRRTRMQQVAGAIWFEAETEARMICFRSVARYVFGLLSVSAQPGGAVGYH
ncbi:sarcosine oxidase subunit gamma [Roseicyclus sp.]|uniref:sarcosine oxidase subunit gamma n=1 Tax=Roseicyclus sp. TaxID=1914329 RepID=UPI003F6CCC93